MTIVLVRHGETAGNHARVVQIAETPLNETGLRQAELVAVRLAALGPARLLCSDLPRACMTAAPLVRATGLELELEPLLQERNFGDLRGRPYSDFAEGHPFGLDLAPPNGETWDVFHARVERAFAAVRARRASTRGPLIVITHGLVLRSIFERLASCGTQLLELPFHNTSVSVLNAESPHVAELLNCTAHLGERPKVAGAA